MSFPQVPESDEGAEIAALVAGVENMPAKRRSVVISGAGECGTRAAFALREAGWRVDYVRLDDPDNSGSFTGEMARAVARHVPDRIVVTAGASAALQLACLALIDAGDAVTIEVFDEPEVAAAARAAPQPAQGGLFDAAPTAADVLGRDRAHVTTKVALAPTLAAGVLATRSQRGAARTGTLLAALVGSTVATGASLALFAWAAYWAIPAAVVLLLVCISVSAFVLALQLRLMEVAGRARTLGAAGNHAALNVANALGAWLGGVVLDAGLGYEWCSRVGAVLAAAGAAITLVSAWTSRRAAVAG